MTFDEARAIQEAAYAAGVYRAGIGRGKGGVGYTVIITIGPKAGKHDTRARTYSRVESAKAYLGV